MLIILYVPALHAGYIEFFDRIHKADGLYLIGEEFLVDFPLSQREIRAIKPETMRSLLENSGRFKQLAVLTKNSVS